MYFFICLYFEIEVGEYDFLKIHKQPCELKNKSSMCVLLMPSAVTLDPSGSMCVISVTEESDRKSQNEAL